jgi:hypothetical protein
MPLSTSRCGPVLALLLPASACVTPGFGPTTATYGALAPAEASTDAARTVASILWAHLAFVDEPRLGGADGVVMVFSREVDPLGVAAGSFSVVLADGRPVTPERAYVGPATEGDENRSVVLVGGFGHPTRNPPNHVMVVGLLHAEDGTVLRGLDREIRPFAEPDRVVRAEPMTVTERRCPGARQVIRTYWTDELRGVTAADLSRIRVELAGGGSATPIAFDDHPVEDGAARADNVLDLCVNDPRRARMLRIDANTFVDRAGHPSAEVAIAVAPPAATKPRTTSASRQSPQS